MFQSTPPPPSDPVAADAYWMNIALEQARLAGQQGEVPVGAVIVLDGAEIGRGHNRPISGCDPTAHAEVEALRSAAQKVSNYRLVGAHLYCTVEPCLMCLGAMVHARIARLIFGAADPKVRATQRLDSLQDDAVFNHRFEVLGGIAEQSCAELLRQFFVAKRNGEVPKWS